MNKPLKNNWNYLWNTDKNHVFKQAKQRKTLLYDEFIYNAKEKERRKIISFFYHFIFNYPEKNVYMYIWKI